MQRVGGTGRRLPDKEGEPDFYEISRNFPLPNPHPVHTGNLAQGAGAAQLAGQYLQHHAPLSPQNPWYGAGYHPTMTLYPQASPSHYHPSQYGGYYPYQHQYPSHPYYYHQHQHLNQHHAPPQPGTATVSAPNSAVMPVQEARSVQSRKAPPEVKSPLTAEEEGVVVTRSEKKAAPDKMEAKTSVGNIEEANVAPALPSDAGDEAGKKKEVALSPMKE